MANFIITKSSTKWGLILGVGMALASYNISITRLAGDRVAALLYEYCREIYISTWERLLLHHGRNDSSGLAVNTTCSNPKKHETCLILLISYPIDSFSMPNLPCRLLKYLPIGIFFVYLFIRIYFLNKSLRVCTYTSLRIASSHRHSQWPTWTFRAWPCWTVCQWARQTF